MSSPRDTRAYSEAMAGADRIVRRATPADAFGRARELFRAGERVDMVRLARDMGVARATLYRWTNDRDRLLADVIWAEFNSLVDRIERGARGSGFSRVQQLAGDLIAELAGSDELRAFLANEGESGLRLLTSPAGPLRPRFVALIAELIERERAGGTYHPPEDPQLLADSLISLVERFLYHGGDPAMAPDPATARRVVALLLREKCPNDCCAT